MSAINHIRIMTTILLWLGCASCGKFVEVPKASNLILSGDVFSSNEAATSAVMGLYNKMVTLNLSLSNGGLSVYTSLSADDLYNPAASTLYDPFLLNVLPAANSVNNSNLWSTAYRNIYHANSIIEGLMQSTAITDALKRQLMGETKLIRAFYFFYLMNLYGDVPLTLTTDFERNAIMPRTEKAEVYRQILADLKECKELLIPAYSSTFRARPNLWAASALLARVYLYTGDWENAEKESSAVIGSGVYALEPDLSKAFVNTSTETIWQLVRETANTAEAAVLIPASTTAIPPLVMTPSLLNSFEAGDLRRTRWTGTNTIGSQAYSYVAKYKIRSGTAVSEYLVVLRLAEQYLIRAEARLRRENTPGAIADLNVLRTRSRAAATPLILNPLPDLGLDLSKTEVETAIAKERVTELFAEWGHRWFDLKRTGKIDQVMGALKLGWKPQAALYPIPLAEVQTNVFLLQNPGYEK